MGNEGKVVEEGPYSPLKSFQIPEGHLPMELRFVQHLRPGDTLFWVTQAG